MRALLIGVFVALGGCVGRSKPPDSPEAAAEPSASERQMDADSMKAEVQRKQREEEMDRGRNDFIGRSQRP